MLCTASLAVAQDVHTDYNDQTNFSQFHTYSWGRVQTDNQLWQPRIQQAVDKDLQQRGWQRVDSGGDVTVTAVGAVRNQQEYRTFYDHMGGWRWRALGNQTTTTVLNERIRTLVVDMSNSAEAVGMARHGDGNSVRRSGKEREETSKVHRQNVQKVSAEDR